MASGKVAGWSYGEEFIDEQTLYADDGVLARARERGAELGADPVLLTTIDPEVENQRAARLAFNEAGIRAARVRTIAGQPRDVIGRLTDHAYDLVSFPAHAPHAVELLDHARRLLRPGGVLVLPHALYHDRVADPTARDATTQSVRALLRSVQESEDLVAALTGSGDGVLAAVLRP